MSRNLVTDGSNWTSTISLGSSLGTLPPIKNIRYIDETTTAVNNATHAVFDEAWYLQDSRPPAAQLLYDLELKEELSVTFVTDPPTSVPSPYPPLAAHLELAINKKARSSPIPLQLSSVPPAIEHASAAKTAREPIGHIFDPLEIAQV